MTNLFALCRTQGGDLHVKRVRLTQPVQAKIEGLFLGQTTAFLDGITEEVDFAGDWKPDDDELLVIDAPAEASVITSAIAASPMSIPEINGARFQNENIKALFVAMQFSGQTKIVIQLFSAQQILSRRFMLLLDGDTFKELTDPAFTLDNFIHAILEDGKVKFKSFLHVKRIFSLNQFYQEATAAQIDTFCSHPSLSVIDVDAFKLMADQNIRKMVNAIAKTEVLNRYSSAEIVTAAAALNFSINIVDGKMEVPMNRKDAKIFFRFLDDGIYQAPLSAAKYMTNSKRPFAAGP